MSSPTRIGPAIQRRVLGNQLWIAALRDLSRAVSAADPEPAVHLNRHERPAVTEAAIRNVKAARQKSALIPAIGDLWSDT